MLFFKVIADDDTCFQRTICISTCHPSPSPRVSVILSSRHLSSSTTTSVNSVGSIRRVQEWTVATSFPRFTFVQLDFIIKFSLLQIFWNAGCQMVSLNFQTPDVCMQLNQVWSPSNHFFVRENGYTSFLRKALNSCPSVS